MSQNKDDFFGGIFDFDGDGKTSIDEEFLAYQIYEDTFEKQDNYDNFDKADDFNELDEFTINGNNNTFNSYTPPKLTNPNKRWNRNALIFVIAFTIFYLIASSNSCSKSKNHNTYSSSSYRNYSITTTTQKKTSTTTKKTTTGALTTKYKKSTTTKRDPYNAKSYYDAEDFYEDYYDDFFDYEDAEDYYNSHN